ncbi:MAG: hypothetical protein E7637_04970 [Ruminococcaceae bacterium]|nr:hypothetical protein [Oscillospiraceae bacterium]
MISVYKKELRIAFGGIFGYLAVAILLFSLGAAALIFNLFFGYADFCYTLAATQPILVVLIPLLSAGSIATERKKGTLDLLFSLPLRASDVVLGKFFALLTVLAIPTLIASLYPILFSFWGTVPLLSSYLAMLGYLLLDALLIALCMLISSLTRKRAVAAVIGSVACSAIYLCDFAAALIPQVFFSRTLNHAALFARYVGFMGGYLDLSVLVLYLTLTALFLFLTVVSLEKRRTT